MYFLLIANLPDSNCIKYHSSAPRLMTAPKEEPRSIVHSSGGELFSSDPRHATMPPPTSGFDDQVGKYIPKRINATSRIKI